MSSNAAQTCDLKKRSACASTHLHRRNLWLRAALLLAGLSAVAYGGAPPKDAAAPLPGIPAHSREIPPEARILRACASLLPAGEIRKEYDRFTGRNVSQREAEGLFALSVFAFYDGESQEMAGLTEGPISDRVMATPVPGEDLSAPSVLSKLAAEERQKVADFLAEASLRMVEREAYRGGGFLLKMPSVIAAPGGPPSPAQGPRSSLGETSILSEGFESGSWGRWTLEDNASGTYAWGRSTCDKHSGDYSADAVRGGTSGGNLGCASAYPNSLHSWLIDGQCEDFQGASQAWLDYHFSLDSEGSYYDYLGTYFYGEGKYSGWIYTGEFLPWFRFIGNLKQWYSLGDLAASPCNTLAFMFHSDSSSAPGFGARIDDVAISTGALGALSCAITTVPPSGPVPLEVAFQAAVTGASASAAYYWDFDDGSTSSEPNPTHTYASVGEYDPFLEVRDGLASAVANAHVSVVGGAHDACADAKPIPANTFSETFSTSGHTLETGEPRPCGSIGATAWYTFTPGENGTAEISLCGSSFDTVLAVYSGACGSLVPIACNDDSCGRQSRLSDIGMDAGTAYYLQVGGYSSATGTVVLSFAFSPPCGTYVATTDNENNAHTDQADGDWGYCLYSDDSRHPIEFDLNMNGPPPQSRAKLLLLCNDVDESDGEVDRVYLNGHHLGDLTGADEQDSTTVFNIPYLTWVVSGRNLVQIYVDVANPGDPTWCVWLKKAQLVVDDGCPLPATCRTIATDKVAYTHGQAVLVTTEADTALPSQRVRIESDIYDPSGVNVAGQSQVKTLTGHQDDPVTLSLDLPATGADGEYAVESLIFDDATGALHSSCRTSIEVGPPGLELRTGNFNLANVGGIADRFHLWLDITDSAGGALDLLDYTFSVVSQANPEVVFADMLGVPSLAGGASSRWRVLFLIRPNARGGLFFEDGAVRIASSATPSLAYTIPPSSLTISAYGTRFDMKEHAFQFENGAWNSPGRNWLFWPDDIWKACDTISALLDESKRDSFHDSIFSKWFGLFGPAGLCYGMALTSIANYTHGSESGHWGEACSGGEAYCPWNSETDNSWRDAIGDRWPAGGSLAGPDKPFDSSDTYHDTWTSGRLDGNWTLEAAKKILYYFVAQPFYRDSSSWFREEPPPDDWIGKDVLSSFTYDSAKSALSSDNPIGLTISDPSWGAHEVVIAGVLHWNNSYKYIVYDNNQPWGHQASNQGTFREIWSNTASTNQGLLCPVDMDTGDGDTTPANQTMVFSSAQILLPGQDSQHIYNEGNLFAKHRSPSPDARSASVGMGVGFASGPRSSGHIVVTMVGAEGFSVWDDGSGAGVPVVRDGELGGAQAVYRHDPGGVLTVLYLPPALAPVFRIEVRKDARIPRFRVYTSVPLAGGAIEKTGYEHVAVSPEDVTLAVIRVGAANPDHILHRTSGGGTQDALAPGFVTEVTPAPGAVEDFRGVIQAGNILLSWKNPDLPTFSTVRLLRKADVPPAGPDDGEVLAQGASESYSEPLPPPGFYHYAAYTFDVENRPTDSALIALDTRRYSLSGAVREAVSGVGIRGAMLTLEGEGNSLYMGRTGADGGYSFASVPSGQYSLSCQADGYDVADASRTITIYSNGVSADFQASPQQGIQVTSPNGGEEFVAGAQVYISWKSAGVTGNVVLEYSADAGSTWQSVSPSTPNTGAYLWQVPSSAASPCLVRVGELGGSTSDESDGAFAIVPCALACSAAATPAIGFGPLAVALAGAALPSHPECAGVAGVDWDYGDGSPHGTGLESSHTYETPGTYTWRMSLGLNGMTCTRTGTVEVCGISCSASVPGLGTTGQPVSFSSSGALEGACAGTITYNWDFGDGASSSQQNPSHAYASPGQYTWILAASAGGATCTKTGILSISGGGGKPGDCDGNGTVSIGEVQKAINMFLGALAVGCGADGNGDGRVSIGEVQKVINVYLGIGREC